MLKKKYFTIYFTCFLFLSASNSGLIAKPLSGYLALNEQQPKEKAQNTNSLHKKLIGTWYYLDKDKDIRFLTITTGKIVSSLPNGSFHDTRVVFYSWSDPYKDGIAIQVDDKFATYIATDTNLFLKSNIDSVTDRSFYLTRYTPRPPSALIGNWVLRQSKGDIDVSITKTRITLKRGRTTSVTGYQVDDEFPFLCCLSYIFIDDKQVLVQINLKLFGFPNTSDGVIGILQKK